MQSNCNTEMLADFRLLEASELDEAHGAIGPLAVIAIMAASAAAGVIAGVVTAAGKGGGSDITWQQVIDTAQGRPPA